VSILSSDPFCPPRGRAPELYEVLETLEKRVQLPSEAAAAAEDFSTTLEDAYDLEENEEVAEEVKAHADVVVEILKKFFRIPDDGK